MTTIGVVVRTPIDVFVLGERAFVGNSSDFSGWIAHEIGTEDLQQTVALPIAAEDDAAAIGRKERAAVVAGGVHNLALFAGRHVHHPEIALRLWIHFRIEERAAIRAKAAFGRIAVAVADQCLEAACSAVRGVQVHLHNAHLRRKLPAVLAGAALVAGRFLVGRRHDGAAKDQNLRVLWVEPSAGVRAAFRTDALDVGDR